MILEHIYFRYLASPCQREGSTLSTWWVLPPSSGLSSCPVFIWPLCRATTRMDFAPLSPPTVTSHPGSPATVTGGLDPGWQSSTGEPLPYSLSITGDPSYLSLATNGTPVNMIDILQGEKGGVIYPEKIAGATNMYLAASGPTTQLSTQLSKNIHQIS